MKKIYEKHIIPTTTKKVFKIDVSGNFTALAVQAVIQNVPESWVYAGVIAIYREGLPDVIAISKKIFLNEPLREIVYTKEGIEVSHLEYYVPHWMKPLRLTILGQEFVRPVVSDRAVLSPEGDRLIVRL